MTMTKFTGWVTKMFTFRKNDYTVAMAFATNIVEIQWLPLRKIGFLMQFSTKIASSLASATRHWTSFKLIVMFSQAQTTTQCSLSKSIAI
jgi:hypothetical protein